MISIARTRLMSSRPSKNDSSYKNYTRHNSLLQLKMGEAFFLYGQSSGFGFTGRA